MQFSAADQPDIVRAAQKDDFYKRIFSDQCYDLFSRIFGPRASMNKQMEVKLLADACYYCLNTLVGTQTLGEEYCDILQVKYPVRLPSMWERASLIFCHVFVPYITERACIRLSVAQPRFVPHLRDLLPKLQRMHLALFYFTGTFYDFSKRLTDIQYIFNGKLDQQRPKYHILGVLILVQFGVSLMIFIRERLTLFHNANGAAGIEDHSDLSQNTESPQINFPKCTLCLEPRRSATATTCGHLFCWSCITEWCNSKVCLPNSNKAQENRNTKMLVIIDMYSKDCHIMHFGSGLSAYPNHISGGYLSSMCNIKYISQVLFHDRYLHAQHVSALSSLAYKLTNYSNTSLSAHCAGSL